VTGLIYQSAVREIADIIQNAAEYTPYWTDDPATHQDPYENAAKALIEAGYKKVEQGMEYAIQYRDAKASTWLTIGEWFGYGPMDYWTSLKNREEYIDDLRTDYPHIDFLLVKRDKPGKVWYV
jgi:hypothetical protein